MGRQWAAWRWIGLMAAFAGLCGCTELQTLRERTDVQDKEMARLQQENAQFRDAYYKTKESLEGELATQRKNNDDLQHQLDQSKTLKTQNEKDLGDQLRTRTLELDALKNESAEQKKLSDAQAAQLTRDLQGATAERDAALKNLKDMDTRLTAEQGRTKALTDQVATLTVASQQTAAKLDALQKDAAKRDQDMAQREKDLKTEKDALAASEKKNADLSRQLATANKSLDDAKGQLGVSQKALEAAKKSADAASAGQADLQSKAQSADKAAEEIKQLRADKTALEAQVAKLKSAPAPAATAAAAPSLENDPHLKAAETALTGALGDLPDGKSVRMRLDASGLRVILPSDLIFDKGGIILSDAGKALLKSLAPEIAKLAKERHIRVEGHTDNQPVADLPFADNWGLGFARADKVRAYLSESGVGGANMTALTRAQNSPLVSNDSPEHRAENRRVEIVIGAPAGA